jgi:hypothetical protein
MGDVPQDLLHQWELLELLEKAIPSFEAYDKE